MSQSDTHRFQQDLLENESFISWVRSEFIHEDEIWSAFIDDHIDRMDEINEAIRVVGNFHFTDRNVVDKDKLWSRIESSAKGESVTQVRTLMPKKIRYLVALIAAACLVLLFVYRGGMSDVRKVEAGMAREVAENLPDGSSVRLDAGTTIKYSSGSWSRKRHVDLQGTAFFEVKKGADFVVKTTSGEVRVLGTSFSVEAREGRFEVICKTGRVEVKSAAGINDAVVLGPGDMARLENGKLQQKNAENGAENNITWLDGIYTFDSVPLAYVIAEIERQFDVKVQMPSSVSGLLYAGYFRADDLDKAMQSVTWPLKLKYSIQGEKVIVSQ